MDAMLGYAFGPAARDADGNGLADRGPARPADAGALVDIRTDLSFKAPRDGRGRLHAYLDAGHTGVDLGRTIVNAGWADAEYGSYARIGRMSNARDHASGVGAGAWLLCHADFDRPATERFDGYAACPQSFNVDGTPMDTNMGFVRSLIAVGGCDAAAPMAAAWTSTLRDTNGDGIADPQLPDGVTCNSIEHLEAENPALEVTCRNPAGTTVVFWAAS